MTPARVWGLAAIPAWGLQEDTSYPDSVQSPCVSKEVVVS